MIEPVQQNGLLIACLCATWCKTCTEFRGTFDKPLFYGVTMPQEGVVQRTLASLKRDDRDAIEVPDEIAGLPESLSARF